MRRVLILPCVALLCLLGSCGGGNNGSSTPSTPTSKIKKRALVSNQFKSQVEIVNAASDAVNLVLTSDASGNTVSTIANVISAPSGPTLMAVTPDKKLTVVFARDSNTLDVITNATETETATIGLPDITESIVVSPDSAKVYAAVRNAPVSGQPSGAVEVVDLVNNNIAASIPVPAVRRIALSHNGNKILAFSDNTDQMWIVDTSARAAVAVAGFDRPTWGVFTTDDSKAYILSCGPECGGTTAKVTIVDMGTNTPGASVGVSAATMGFMDGSNLYVAGTAASGGRLDVVSVSSFTISKAAVPISDGFHDLMALASNNRLFIGAHACSNRAGGCLSIFNTSSQTAVLSGPNGDVTGMQPIDGRNVVYVIEGGELRIYDTTTDAPQPTQIDIVGKAFDVKTID